MDFNESVRRSTNSIILFILKNGDRHTDELKEIIDETFDSVKIGTLYSIIARMKTQGYISEYRASSNDGSRRKYYKITKSGEKLFDLEYANLFDGIVLPNKNEITETEVKNEPNIDSETEELYLKYIQKAQIDDFDIDFSKVEEPKIEEKVETVEIKNEPIFKEQEVVEDNESKISNDFDSVISSKYEYKSVLTKLFPKPSKNTYFDYDFEAYTQPKEEVQDVKVNVIEEENPSSLDELYELSEKENVKIRTSNDTNRYQGTKILSNKLRFHSSILLTVIAVLEYLLMTLIFSSSVKFETSTLLKIGLIFGSFTLLNGLIYLFRTNHSVKDLSKFINSFEIALVLTISVIIISICIASINSIDVYSFESVYNYIILPSVMAVNIPIFVLLMHFLSKLEIYQTV